MKFTKTFHSFEELQVLSKKKPGITAIKEVKCRKCGGPLVNIAGTNVYICHGEVPLVEDDKEVFVMNDHGEVLLDAEGNPIHKMTPCTNYILSKT